MKTDKIEFASFAYPKPLFVTPRGKPAQRLAAKRAGTGYKFAAGGYFSPKPCPLESQDEKGKGFYLESTGGGQPFGLRWDWADEVADIRHTGWFCDDYQDEKIRGIVLRLPKGRGFLAGWSMGEGMASEVEYYVYETIREAARAADSLAESAAEKERDFREEEERKRQEEEEREAAEELESALCNVE